MRPVGAIESASADNLCGGAAHEAAAQLISLDGS
jgi:hypothetical protein